MTNFVDLIRLSSRSGSKLFAQNYLSEILGSLQHFCYIRDLTKQ